MTLQLTSPRVPQEIIEYVTDFLHDDPSTLISCSLTNSCWLRPARFHLYHTITVDSSYGVASEEIRPLLILLLSSKMTREYTRELHFVGGTFKPYYSPLAIPFIHQVLQRLPNLHTLKLFNINLGLDDQSIELRDVIAQLALPPTDSFPNNLRKLSITCVPHSQKRLMSVLSWFNSIRLFHLSDYTTYATRDPESTSTSSLTSNVKIVSLHIDNTLLPDVYPQYLPSLPETLKELTVNLKVQDIPFRSATPGAQPIQHLNSGLLDHVGSNLSALHLRFENMSTGRNFDDPARVERMVSKLNLVRCVGLEKMTVSIINLLIPPGDIHLLEPHLRKIDIWEELEECILNTFDKLRSLTMTYGRVERVGTQYESVEESHVVHRSYMVDRLPRLLEKRIFSCEGDTRFR
ncbi:hypothetical protein C8Q75DRAFT_785999 [Abortiporus biennis]|nr:hypothetical protein C8Q75DRAFT_785999 [Abortiporus biennis]